MPSAGRSSGRHIQQPKTIRNQRSELTLTHVPRMPPHAVPHSTSISKTEPISALFPPKTALRSVNPVGPGQVAKPRVVINSKARGLVSGR